MAEKIFFESRCFLFLCTVFFFFFKTLFFLLAFFLPLTLLVMHLDQYINIYLEFESGISFCKRDFKSSWSAYWPCLRPEKKKHKLSRPVPPLKQLIFFGVSWHHDKQHTCSTPQTVLIYTQHPPVTHWKLNLPFVHRLNHQYYYPKISTRFGPKK